jgi:hypothetical protein
MALRAAKFAMKSRNLDRDFNGAATATAPNLAV